MKKNQKEFNPILAINNGKIIIDDYICWVVDYKEFSFASFILKRLSFEANCFLVIMNDN